MASGPYRKGSKWVVRHKENGVHKSFAFASEAEALVHLAVLKDPSALQKYGLPTVCPKPPRKRSSRASGGLLSEDQVEEVLEIALGYGAHRWAILHFIARYGIRPITYCDAAVEGFVDVEERPFLTNLRNKNGENFWHPLFQEDAEILRGLVKGRGPKEPLFLGPKDRQWKIRYDKEHPQGRALGLSQWYQHSVAPRAGLSVSSGQAGVYRLKHYAITRMKQGAEPWPSPLTSADVSVITGIKTKSVIDNNYTETNTFRLVQLTKQSCG